MKSSVCTILKNEEENISCSIEHLIDWVYEIVIVDNSSSENTKQIALT